MKYHARHVLKGSLDEVLEILRDRTRDLMVYPNISRLAQKRWDESDADIHCEYVVCGDGEIPRPLRMICTPNMLSWREIGCWDKKNNRYTYKLRSFHLTHLVHAKGEFRFTPLGDDAVVRELDAEMRIDIPLLGGLAVRTIVAYQLDNYEREARQFDMYLEEHRKKKSAG
jgi:hypothetical protein